MLPTPIQQLSAFIQQVFPLPEAVLADFVQPWHPVAYKRKTMLTREGQTEPYLYFVTEGIQRAFCFDPAMQKEATLVFTYPPSFSGVADSFLLQQPSRFFLETLTASKMLRLSFEDFNRLLLQYPILERWLRIALSAQLAGTLQRQQEILCYSAEEKFRSLLQRSPHVLNLIPHKYLASYLGMDASTFSKLLSNTIV